MSVEPQAAAPDSRADLALQAAVRLSGPLIELLVREGVSYSQFASSLKNAFVGAAEQVLTAAGAKVTDSSLSTLSGVHRKDVRAWREAGQAPAKAKNLSAAMETFARWSADPDYLDQSGNPLALDAHGKSRSFDALAYSISKDVRPNVILQELLRLGLARRIDGDGEQSKIELCTEAFVPKSGTPEMMQLFADNVGDHIAAAASNIAGSAPMLEQSVFGDGFSDESIAALSDLSRKIWASGAKEFVRRALALNRRDEGRPNANRRFRFGMYCYRGQLAHS